MDLSFFRGETVTIVRKAYFTTENAYGNFANTSEELEAEAVVAVEATQLNSDFTNATENTTIALIFNNGMEIFPYDIFIVRGSVWEKDGSAISSETVFTSSNSFMPQPLKVSLKQIKGPATHVTAPPTPQEATNG
jgi:hypothetical protein